MGFALVLIQGDKKSETHEHVHNNFNFQATATKRHTYYLNLMHGLHTKFHQSGLITFRLMTSFHNVLKMSPSALAAHLNTTREVLNDSNALLWNLTNLRRHGLLQLVNICIPIDNVFEVAP